MPDKKIVVLIQPKETDVDLIVNRPYLPLALLSISRYIHEKYRLFIIDQRTESDWELKLSGLPWDEVICVGVSCLLGNQIGYSLEVSRYVKKISSCPVIWGGIHDPLLARQALESGIVDGVVCGEGEESFPRVIEYLNGKGGGNIPGFINKDFPLNKEGPQSGFLDMDSFPDLPYYLINLDKYMKFRGGDYSIALETSRGCDFRCAFCACPQYSGRWRGQSSEKTVASIKRLVEEFKVSTILVVDDNFFGDMERAKKIFRGLISQGVKINLDIQGMRIDAVENLSDLELKEMCRAGVRKVNIGIESGSSRLLKFINKGITLEQVLRQNHRLSLYGPRVQYNFITGYPTETKEEIRQTVRFAMKLISENKNAMLNYFCIYTPLPGSKLYSFQQQSGEIFPGKIEGWAGYDRIFVSQRNDSELNKRLNILALFVDKKVCYYARSPVLKFLAALYRPVARLRLRHFFLKGFLEGRIFLAINRFKLKF